jgi:hypothetical protein
LKEGLKACFPHSTHFPQKPHKQPGQIVTNTTGSTVTLLNTESVPNLVLPPFTVSTVGTGNGDIQRALRSSFWLPPSAIISVGTDSITIC